MMKGFLFSEYTTWERNPSLCHLDRSVAQWRDLRFSGPFLGTFLTEHDRRKTQVSKARPGPPTHLTRVFAVDWAIPFPSGFALLTVAVLVSVVPALAVTFT